MTKVRHVFVGDRIEQVEKIFTHAQNDAQEIK